MVDDDNDNDDDDDDDDVFCFYSSRVVKTWQDKVDDGIKQVNRTLGTHMPPLGRKPSGNLHSFIHFIDEYKDIIPMIELHYIT